MTTKNTPHRSAEGPYDSPAATDGQGGSTLPQAKALQRQVEEGALHFTPWGLGGAIAPEAAAQLLHEEMEYLKLHPSLPDEVHTVWHRAQRAYEDGLFNYDSFTVADGLGFKVTEVALKRRFVSYYSEGVPLVQGGNKAPFIVSSFDQVEQRLRAGRGDRETVSIDGYPQFNGSLKALLRWARGEGLLGGQRARNQERAHLWLRNNDAHSDRPHLLMPPDVFRGLQFTCELVNRLWGHRTAGGQHYPAAIPREVVLYGREIDEPMNSATTPLELIRDHREAAALADDGWQYWVLVIAPQDDLFCWDVAFEATAYPVTVLAGPMDVSGAIAELLGVGTGATTPVDFIDRTFYVRASSGVSIDQPRTRAQMARVPDRAGDRWMVVQADHPNHAWGHVQAVLGRTHPQLGPCPNCPVTSLLGPSHRSTAMKVGIS